MTIGEKIRTLRKARHFSQEQVAELLGVSRQTVSKWETNEAYPNPDNLKGLAEIFQVAITELTNPDNRVALVYDLKAELTRRSRGGWRVVIAILAGLFAITFSAALYGRWHGADQSTVFLLVCLSAAFILAAFLPLWLMILRFVYQDCRRRGLKPTFYVLISCSVVGLAYYILQRDYLTDLAKSK